MRDLEGGGKEFQLRNDEGAVLIPRLPPARQWGAGFEFVEPIEPTQRAMVRGIPGARQNIVVQPVSPYTVQVAGGRSLDFTLAMLRSASSLYVRAASESASFAVFGSAMIVEQCVEQMEDRAAGHEPRHGPAGARDVRGISNRNEAGNDGEEDGDGSRAARRAGDARRGSGRRTGAVDRNGCRGREGVSALHRGGRRDFPAVPDPVGTGGGHPVRPIRSSRSGGVTMRGRSPAGSATSRSGGSPEGYFLAIASGPRARTSCIRMLRNAASLTVRAGEPGTCPSTSSGSDQIVSQCLQQQEGRPAGLKPLLESWKRV